MTEEIPMLQRFHYLVEALKPTDRIGILHDTDPDGMSAGVLLARALEKKIGVKPFNFTQHHGAAVIFKDTIQWVQGNKLTKLFILDLPAENNPEPLQETAELVEEVCIIDHHPSTGPLSLPNVILVKPSLLRTDIPPERYCTAKMVFDLFDPLVGLNDLAWLATVGILGDYGLDAWKPFVLEAFAREGLTEEEGLKTIKHIMGVNGAFESVAPERLQEFFDVLFAAAHPREVLRPEFYALRAQADAELDYWAEQFDQRAERFPDVQLSIYIIKPKFSIKGALVNKLSFQRFFNESLVTIEDLGEPYLLMSLRRQDRKVDMGELFRRASQGLAEAAGGGHVPAAGGKIRREDLPVFKEGLKRAMKELLPKDTV